MAGEIVIFAKTGCPHCLHAKQTLRESDLRFKEILVDENQQIRQFLKKLTNKSSIPQIFFNGVHIGGNDDLQSLRLDDVKWQELIDDVRENPTKLVFDFSGKLERVAVSDDFFCEPDEKAGIIREMMREGIFNNCRKSILSPKKILSITPASFIEWYTSSKNTINIEAKTVLKDLLSKKYLIPVNNSVNAKFAIESNNLLRLNDGSDSSALNAGPTNFCKLENPASLGNLLRKQLTQLYDKHISPDGKKVDYQEMKNSPIFAEYLSLCREFQLSPIEQFSEDEKKAFFINVYNAMVIHAIVQNGPPSTGWAMFKFFSSFKYIIGGEEYSLDDIESGILRGNKRPAMRFFRPFSTSDPRKFLMLQNSDPRIHFALNCGLESCPPIKTYSAENIDTELQSAAKSYLESESGVRIMLEEDSSVISLSSVFRWHGSDFGKSPQEVMNWAQSYLSEDRKLQLEKALSGKYKISYMDCECQSNSSS